jgi:hypothetical protein
MSRSSVKGIMQEIESLSAEDRIALDRQLTRQLQRDWIDPTGKARQTARRRGIDQATIDRAIERRRYGR